MNFNKIKNKNILFIILVIILCFVLSIYIYNFYKISAKNNFANQATRIAKENENAIFRIDKILLYNSADGIDNSEGEILQNLNICQYTDIAIYIDNKSYISDLTPENTVSELWIDDIKIKKNNDIGISSLNYKNPFDFAKFRKIENSELIKFNILNTNDENQSDQYSSPTFYTDCSNPISLGYLNTDIISNYSIQDDSSSISFNGKILKETNINLKDISYTLSFKIHIKNNQNEKFVYDISLNPLQDGEDTGIYNGYSFKQKRASGTYYNFFKEL